MKSLALILFVFVLLASLSAFAQYGNQGSTDQQTSATEQTSTKAVTLSGKVGDDGKSFVSDKDNKSWTVSNPEALKGHEGQEVKIKAHEDAAKNEVHVVSVKKVKGEKAETMKKDEMKK
jgi:membrane protein implicated in regulation of membrane protease activity